MLLLKTAFFTVFQAALSTALALLIGLPAAFFTSRRKFPMRNFLLSLSSVPFCIPSLLVALGYVSFFGMNGTLNRFLMDISGSTKPPVTFLYSFAGIIICHGFYNFPLVMSTVSDAWERLPQTESEAAKLLGAGKAKIFRTITLWQLMPAITSACIPVFLYCFFSFMIVLLFGAVGTTTLEVEIYQQAKVNLNYPAAIRLGAIETAIAMSVAAAYTFIEQKSHGLRGISFSSAAKEKPQLINGGLAEKTAASLVFALIILFFICPFFSIIYNALSSKQLSQSITLYNFTHLLKSKSFWSALKWTSITACLTGFFCAATAFAYAAMLRTSDPDGKHFSLRLVPILPMAVSSVVTGVIITCLVRQGNFIVLVIAQTLLNWPVAFRQIYTSLAKLPQSTVDAGTILSRSPLDVVFRIYLPVCRRAFLRAAGFCFAISAGDATLPLVLAIPRFDTIALYTYRLAGRYKFNEACASGAILGLLCIAVFALSKGRTEKKETDK